MFKKLIVLVLILFGFLSLFSQENKNTQGIPDFLKSVVPYGTFEYALAGNSLGWSIVDIIPRIGLKGQWSFDNNDKYFFFTTAEFGLKLTSKDNFVHVSADPGASYAQINNAIFARQGFIGIGTPFGRISIGKQWSVHYTLAGNIDNMYMFGGMAIGVYNAGSDGGPSGTGRADQSLKYELFKGHFYFGAQAQIRDISDNNRHFIDTYGAATYYDFSGFKIGLSYNRVLDGVEKPTKGAAKINDEFLAVLIDYNKANFHFGILPQIFNNHEKTDEDDFFKGYGFETNLKINFGKNKKWALVNNISLLMPMNDEDTKYMWNKYDFEIARRFSKNTAAILGFRFDNSTNHDGSKPQLHTVSIGFYYNFNYPIP